jgi:phage minor structural protein
MEFKSNGLGSLPDAISCKVTEERNGCYELEMEYPVGGLHYDLIEPNRIIYAKPNETSEPQPFDIKEITPSMDKMTAKVYAQHVRYRLNGIPVSPFNAQGINDALGGLKQYSLIKHPFTFYTDIVNESSKFNVGLPGTLGSLLGGTKGSILDTFSGNAGCEYEFDKFNVKLHAHRGTDSGVSIRYAKNLTGCKMESSIESVYTGVLAFWQKEEDGKEQLLSGGIQYIANHDSYPREYIYMLDCSYDFEEIPTVEQLNAKASNYAVNNRIGNPSVSVDVEFIPLWNSEEFKAIAPLERVCLCDTVTVKFEELGVSVKAIVNKTVYDVLAERYESISIGSAKSKLSETIKQEAHDQAESVKKDTISAVQGSIDKAVDKIRGGTNGHVILSVNSNGETNELYAYDGNSLETASKVLRLNYEGIGGTDKGVNGKYNVAITIDGQINASNITFGEMNGNLIKAKSLQIGSFDEDTENTITSSLSEAVTEWYVSTSPTELIGGTWSEERPSWTNSNYIWQRLRTENKKGEISYSEPSCVQGNDGSSGDDAILLYIDSSNGTTFKNSSVATIFTVSIYVGGNVIDNSTALKKTFGDQAHLRWLIKRYGETEFSEIPSNDSRLNDEGFIFTLSAKDIRFKAVFNCELNI